MDGLRFSDQHLIELRNTTTDQDVKDLSQLALTLKQALRGSIGESRKVTAGFFKDNKGKNVVVSKLGICELCPNVSCQCDGDEEGFYMCANHRLHPYNPQAKPAVICTLSRLKEKFPRLSEFDILDELAENEVWTYVEAVPILMKISSEFRTP